MSAPSEKTKTRPIVTVAPISRSSSSDGSKGSTSSPSTKAPSLKSPRTPRFAEATAVNSPIEPKKLPFSDRGPRASHYMAQPQPADIGFGYVNRHESVEMPDTDDNDYPPTPRSPMRSPLRSALRTPAAPPKAADNPRTTTFREEEILEKHEKITEKRQREDLRAKTRVRIAKLLLRGVNFSCSLIVLSMLATTFSIFNATKSIPPRNNLPPWAQNQKTWPQITLLCISCVSLTAAIIVLWGYYRGGHRRGTRNAAYQQAFAVAFFIFSIVMWGVGAGILQHSKNNSDNKDMWGWSCVNNQRKQLFESDVQYNLICTLQNWSLLCAIIEIVIEILTISIYMIVFLRFISRRKLRKTMANRDKARSNLYIAQMRREAALNTPGLAPPGTAKSHYDYYAGAPDLEAGPDHTPSESTQYVDPTAAPTSPSKPFQLQAPPIKITGATPKMAQLGFTPVATLAREPTDDLSEDQQLRSPLMTGPLPPASPLRSPLRSPLLTPGAPVPVPSPLPSPGPLRSPGSRQTEHQREHVAAAPGEAVYDDVPIPGAYQAPPVVTIPQTPTLVRAPVPPAAGQRNFSVPTRMGSR